MLPQDTVTPSEVPVELPVEIVFQILEWGVRVSHKFSLSASLVCKETRRLALPHVFKTLFIRDADRVISNHHFLPYPSLVQNIWFDPPTQDENMRSDPKTPFPPSSGRLNITHLAVCNTASLAAIDCDPSSTLDLTPTSALFVL
ncbi:hypothetical protein JAAARDRAFT_36694 [Jaapia argillacea MUCL 33604]|uniref:F-box domain-containing protein n=1 Tax=Jaapia argillacea MUCL 33604 TaxID=933084 RepID=A0A067PQ42_9AGAM|nr:hypothetical protein JAAARDRAFT_36694 [Jaapia argillacea MUCL 33604]